MTDLHFHGYNIAGRAIADRNRLKARLLAAPPRWLVVRDDVQLANELAGLLQGTRIVYRHYWPANGDEQLYHQRPEDWIAQMEALGLDSRVWWHAGNEMTGDDDAIAAWLIQAGKLAQARGRRCALGNWGTGHPADGAWGGPYLPLLRYIDSTQYWHVLFVHEYAFRTFSESVEHLIGRVRRVARVCAEHGLRIEVALSEHGHDLTGELGAWRDLGKSPAEYADDLAWAARHVYLHPELQGVVRVTGACIFQYGALDEVWRRFDVEDSDVPERLAAERIIVPVGEPVEPPAPTWPTRQGWVRLAEAKWDELEHGNIREPVGGAVMSRLGREWMPATIYDGRIDAGGIYQWQWFRVNGQDATIAVGWFDFVDELPVEPPEPEEPTLEERIAALEADMQLMVDAIRTLALDLTVALASYKTTMANIERLQ